MTEIQDTIATRSSLGKIIGDAIKKELNLPDSAFALTIDFVDADAAAPGFQATAIVKIDITKSVTKSVGFDLNLPDLGPVDVTTGGNIDFTVGGKLDLDFGFRFGTFTPYLLNTTAFQLTTSIDSTISAQAGIGGIGGGLEGKLQLKKAQFLNPASVVAGGAGIALAGAPSENLLVVHARVYQQRHQCQSNRHYDRCNTRASGMDKPLRSKACSATPMPTASTLQRY